MPNQQGAPLPQDVHPQAYQTGVNGPPGVQWGASAPAPAPPHHAPPPAGGANIDWNRRLADIPNPQAPSQQPALYDQRDAPRPATTSIGRPASPPRQEPLRSYHEPRVGAPPRRGLSPSPKSHNSAGHYAATPVMPPQPAPGPPPPPSQQGPPPQTRITNPNYGGQTPSVAHPQAPLPPPPAQTVVSSANGLTGPQLPSGPALRNHPDHARMATPPPVRPIIENKPPSPGANYPHQYQHHPNTSMSSGIADGAPAPASAVVASENAARERDERAPLARKRYRDRDDDLAAASKRLSNDESRSRLDDHASRRPSPPDRINRAASPTRRSSTESRRLDDARRPVNDYHPSDAAHHPSLNQANGHVQHQQPLPPPQHQHQHSQPPVAPSQHQQPPQQQMSTQMMSSEPAKEDRREVHEPPARKMEVDEDYDDSGEDEKRNVTQKSEKSSPRGPTSITGPNGPPPATAQAEAKA